MQESKVYILADQYAPGSYSATELISDVDNLLNNIEYIDVANKECQVWEYPSGNIYELIIHKLIANSDDTYFMDNPKQWVAKMHQVQIDQEKVRNGYMQLNS